MEPWFIILLVLIMGGVISFIFLNMFSAKDVSMGKGKIMKIVLVILSIIALVVGIDFYAQSKSAIHQILAFMSFVISAITFSGAGIIAAIDSLKEEALNTVQQTDEPSEEF